MNHRLQTIISVITLTLITSAAQLHAGETLTLFDGKTLKGWTGNPDLWTVEDGVIVGSTMKNKTGKNTFLILEDIEAADFTLTYEAKLEGGNNSGVQYRSKVKDAATWSVIGYQADMHPKPQFVGMLYGEGLGRGIIAKRGDKTVIDEETGKSKVLETKKDLTPIDLTKWQTYTITATGNHLVHKVNGEVTVDLKDTHKDNLSSGVIALQVHAGKPMKVSFRNIQLTHKK